MSELEEMIRRIVREEVTRLLRGMSVDMNLRLPDESGRETIKADDEAGCDQMALRKLPKKRDGRQ